MDDDEHSRIIRKVLEEKRKARQEQLAREKIEEEKCKSYEDTIKMSEIKPSSIISGDAMKKIIKAMKEADEKAAAVAGIKTRKEEIEEEMVKKLRSIDKVPVMSATKIVSPEAFPDLPVKEIVTSFIAFKDNLQLIFDKAKSVVVNIPFDAHVNGKNYTFASDEIITLSDIGIDEKNKKLFFKCVYGTSDKAFTLEEAEVIQVNSFEEESLELDTIIKNECRAAFAGNPAKIATVASLHALMRNNPGLEQVLNNAETYLEQIEQVGKAEECYRKLAGFGRY